MMYLSTNAKMTRQSQSVQYWHFGKMEHAGKDRLQHEESLSSTSLSRMGPVKVDDQVHIIAGYVRYTER